MATKKISIIQKTADQIKTQTKQVADTAIIVSETLVDGSLEKGEQWQKLMAKTLKGGTVLFGKQQDMVLDTLEIVRDQYLHGNVRFRKLFGIKSPSFFKAIEKAAKPATDKVKAMKETSNIAIEMATNTISKAVKGTSTKTKKATKATATSAKDKAVKATKAAPKKAKTVTTKKKATTKKVTAKKVTKKATAKKVTAPKTSNKDNLTKIEGIGPKIEQLLNKAGIRTFRMLGSVDVKTLKTVLENAGPRYKMHNPKTWRQQAKLAATGKWDKLNDLQKELKGGVKVKK